MTAKYLSWSGPDRALSEHMELWRTATQAATNRKSNYHKWWRAFTNTWGHLVEDKNAWLRDGYAAQFVHDEATMLNEATTYYVSHNMAEIITQATVEAEPDKLYATDLQTPSGFIVFEYPLVVSSKITHLDLDDDGAPLDLPEGKDIDFPVRAIGWYSAPIGERDSDPGLVVEEGGKMKTAPGAIFVIYCDQHSVGQNQLSGHLNWGYGSRLAPADLIPWRFDTEWVESLGEVTATISHDYLAFMRKWLTSFFRLMWQELVMPDPWGATRTMRRKAARVGWAMPLDGEVKVLKLRKIARPPTPRESDMPKVWTLNYRTVTRGHWRNQWYQKLGPARLDDGSVNPDSHRRIYINPFIRGPEEAPLVIKHNVTAVTR